MQTKAPFLNLFLNHMDAWQVAFITAALPLIIHQVRQPQHLWLVLAIGNGVWLAFALNDYYDAPFDAIDADKARGNFFVQVRVKRRYLWLVVGLHLAFLLAAFAQYGRLGVMILALGCFVMWAYSAPPLRLKQRPGLDLLTHALFVQTFPYAVCLMLIGTGWKVLDGMLLIILFLASLTAQLEQQTRDFAIDVQTGGNFTTCVGRRRVLRGLKLATAVLILVAFAAVIQGTIPGFLLPFGLIGLPALLHRFFRPDGRSRSQRLVLLSTTAGFLYAGGIFIYFLLS